MPEKKQMTPEEVSEAVFYDLQDYLCDPDFMSQLARAVYLAGDRGCKGSFVHKTFEDENGENGENDE